MFQGHELLQAKVKGTVWAEVNDEKLYAQLDLKDFEFNFSAYQKQDESELLNRSMSSIKAKGRCACADVAPTTR